MAVKIDVAALLDGLRHEAALVVSTLREQGTARFARAIALAGFLVFAAYAGVYAPPGRAAERLESKIASARATAEHSGRYLELREQLSAAYARLPSQAQRDQWLSDAVRESIRAGDLVTEDFRPTREQELNGLVFQTAGVAMTLRFQEFYDWLLRIEGGERLLHLQSLELIRKQDRPGYNTVSCEVSTIVPRKRYR